MDNHHPFGVSNDAYTTVPIPVNDHQAELNEAQQDWPEQTLKNPDGSPLLKAAGCIRGFIDTILQLIKSGLLWIADMLEKADIFLTDEFGPKYWIGTPLEPESVEQREHLYGKANQTHPISYQAPCASNTVVNTRQLIYRAMISHTAAKTKLRAQRRCIGKIGAKT